MKISQFQLLTTIFIFLYSTLAIFFYFVNFLPYINQDDLNSERLLADTLVFLRICSSAMEQDGWYWLRDAGPCIALNVFNYSMGLITIFNVIILIVFARYTAVAFGVKFNKFFILLLVNPIVFLSLFGPNKEIFGICSTLSLLVFLQARTISSLLLALLFSMLTRYSSFVSTVLFLPFIFFNFGAIGRRPTVLISCALLVVLSAILPRYIMNIHLQLGDLEYISAKSVSVNFSLYLDEFVRHGFYSIVMIIRVMLNLFGAMGGFSVNLIEVHGIYHGVGVMGSSFLFLCLTVFILKRHHGKFFTIIKASPHILLFVFVFSIVHTLSPIIQHRYFLPLYPILVVLALSKRPSGSLNLGQCRLLEP